MKTFLLLLLLAAQPSATSGSRPGLIAPVDGGRPAGMDPHGWEPLFDGETLAGWEGSPDAFRVEDGAIVGGTMTAPMPRNEFLCTTEAYDDFALRLRFRLRGEGTNAGVQFHSERIPGSHEVVGYQADLGDGWWGALYDESRRNRKLVGPDEAALARVLDREGWNDYAIYTNGRRIRLFINGHLTVDYTEPDAEIAQAGRICLQIHSGPPGEAWYKELQIKPLDPRPEAPVAAPSGAVTFRKHVLTPDFLSEGIAPADVDRDGDLDLLAGAYWLEAPAWMPHEMRPPQPFSVHRGYSDTFLSFALDVNRDGWVDVVRFDFPGRGAYWYENPRGRPGHWKERLVHPSVVSESPRFEDVNGDGRMDLLFVDGEAGRVVWLEPPRAPGDTTWTRHAVSATMERARYRGLAHGLGFDDINGDGRPDVFTTDAWWEAPARPDGAWREHPADFGPPAAQMYAHDVDGDGDRDVVASSAHDYGFWWYEQGPSSGGESPSWKQHTIDDRISQTHALARADLDGDGRPDFITGKRFFAHNGNDPGGFEPSVLVWYAAGRDAQGRPTWTPYLIDGDTGVGLHLVVEDLTGDGRPDLVTSSKKGVFLFERVDG